MANNDSWYWRHKKGVPQPDPQNRDVEVKVTRIPNTPKPSRVERIPYGVPKKANKIKQAYSYEKKYQEDLAARLKKFC